MNPLVQYCRDSLKWFENVKDDKRRNELILMKLALLYLRLI